MATDAFRHSELPVWGPNEPKLRNFNTARPEDNSARHRTIPSNLLSVTKGIPNSFYSKSNEAELFTVCSDYGRLCTYFSKIQEPSKNSMTHKGDTNKFHNEVPQILGRYRTKFTRHGHLATETTVFILMNKRQ